MILAYFFTVIFFAAEDSDSCDLVIDFGKSPKKQKTSAPKVIENVKQKSIARRTRRTKTREAKEAESLSGSKDSIFTKDGDSTGKYLFINFGIHTL